MIVTGGRHPFQCKYKAGCDKNGKLVFIDWEVYNDGGHRMPYSTTVLTRALLHFDSCYFFPNIRIRGRACKTNTISNTAMRGFGVPQAVASMEIVMDHFARVAGISREAIREMNLYTTGQTTHFNQPIEDDTIRRIWQQIKKLARCFYLTLTS